MGFNDNARRCKAKNSKGERCKNPAMIDSDYCHKHQENRASDLHLSPWKEDPDTLQLTKNEDKKIFKSVLSSLESDFEFNDSSDLMQAEMAAYYFVKWRQAARDGKIEMLAHYDGLFRKSLKNLKATREKRDCPPSRTATPADLATELVEELRQNEKDKEEADESKHEEEER